MPCPTPIRPPSHPTPPVCLSPTLGWPLHPTRPSRRASRLWPRLLTLALAPWTLVLCSCSVTCPPPTSAWDPRHTHSGCRARWLQSKAIFPSGPKPLSSWPQPHTSSSFMAAAPGLWPCRARHAPWRCSAVWCQISCPRRHHIIPWTWRPSMPCQPATECPSPWWTVVITAIPLTWISLPSTPCRCKWAWWEGRVTRSSLCSPITMVTWCTLVPPITAMLVSQNSHLTWADEQRRTEKKRYGARADSRCTLNVHYSCSPSPVPRQAQVSLGDWRQRQRGFPVFSMLSFCPFLFGLISPPLPAGCVWEQGGWIPCWGVYTDLGRTMPFQARPTQSSGFSQAQKPPPPPLPPRDVLEESSGLQEWWEWCTEKDNTGVPCFV